MTERERKVDRGGKRLLYWAAGLSIGTLAAHAVGAPDHLTEWWGYSSFFVTIAAFQFFYAFGLLLQPWRYDDTGEVRSDAGRRARPYYMLGIVMAASVIVMYIVSRTTGLPFLGPDAVVEPVTITSLVPIAEVVPLLYCLIKLYTGAAAHSSVRSDK